MTPEGKVKAKVQRALKGAYSFMPVQRGMGAAALDFYVCFNGLFIAVETKVPGADLTGRQKFTARQIAAAGGKVFVIRDAADIAHMLRDLESPMQIKATIYDTRPWKDEE